jgi:hypothetical protein
MTHVPSEKMAPLYQIPEKCFERVKRMEFDDTLAVFSRGISNSTVQIEEFPRGINRGPWSTKSN